ncbi:hypothetical protein PR048_026952 [Dryococelus australis]|uniref:Uncharacterized protein n=1 Tax=Dryococelus australis TaxID=614101 RepID=A0ABQ9GMR9_9NEOP|nr:hypothetical protein PR048_026952 [Dryococelus australis]
MKCYKPYILKARRMKQATTTEEQKTMLLELVVAHQVSSGPGVLDLERAALFVPTHPTKGIPNSDILYHRRCMSAHLLCLSIASEKLIPEFETQHHNIERTFVILIQKLDFPNKGYTLSEMSSIINCELKDPISNKQLKEMLIDHYDKIRSTNVIKSAAVIHQEECKEYDFHLDDKLCDEQDLLNSLTAYQDTRPESWDEFFSFLIPGCNSGAREALTGTETFRLKVVESVMSGSHYAREVRGLSLLAEAISSLQMIAFFKQHAELQKFSNEFEAPDLDEADERLFLRVHHAVARNAERIIIASSDTDVFVRAVYHSFKSFKKEGLLELCVQCGQGNTSRAVPIHKLVEDLDHSTIEILPPLHAITGCDTTSKSGTKLTALKHSKLSPHLLPTFGTTDICEAMMDDAEEFLVGMLSIKFQFWKQTAGSPVPSNEKA